jgi:hypothetical protein
MRNCRAHQHLRAKTYVAPALPWHNHVSNHLTDRPASPNADDRVRELVLGYLDDHPTAMDTLDGIAEWWILRQQIDIEVRRISRVLDTLVNEGHLERHEQDGVRFYRRHRSAARRLVEGLS